jgi:hypothetical protein
LPEPLLVLLMRRMFKNEVMKIAAVAHANSAHDEMQHLADEFIALARQTDVFTPYINELYAYFDAKTPLLAEGSQEIALDWSGIWLGAGLFAAVLMFVRRVYSRISKPASRRSASTA